MHRCLPILTFHDLADGRASIAFPPVLFRTLLEQIRRVGWRTVSLPEGAAWLAGAGEDLPQPVALTFDDGYRSAHEIAYPLLREHGMTATIFVVTGDALESEGRLPALYGRERLSWGEIREMHAGGMSFGVHTCTHPDLTRLPDASVRDEMLRSQSVLEDALGATIRSFAYPYGLFDARVLNIASKYFDSAVTTHLRTASAASDRHALPRIDMVYFRSARTLKLLADRWREPYLWLRRGPRSLRQQLFGRLRKVG